MRKLYFLIYCLSITAASFSQSTAIFTCKNSIDVKKTINENDLVKGGIIDISVTTTDAFVCILNIEKGAGPKKIAEQRGRGNSIIHFKELGVNNIYQVQLEFLSEDNSSYCKKLQRSQIIFEAE